MIAHDLLIFIFVSIISVVYYKQTNKSIDNLKTTNMKEEQNNCQTKINDLNQKIDLSIMELKIGIDKTYQIIDYYNEYGYSINSSSLQKLENEIKDIENLIMDFNSEISKSQRIDKLDLELKYKNVCYETISLLKKEFCLLFKEKELKELYLLLM